METTPEPLPRLVKVIDLARDCDVAQDTIFRLIRAGKLPMVKVGRHVRIPREAAERLITKGIS